jgi:hypothetical protein
VVDSTSSVPREDWWHRISSVISSPTSDSAVGVVSGANVTAVQRMLGDASAAMTLDVYCGLFDDDLGALAERMGAGHAARHSASCGRARDRRSRDESSPR